MKNKTNSFLGLIAYLIICSSMLCGMEQDVINNQYRSTAKYTYAQTLKDHDEGDDVYGLAVSPEGHLVTSGDDGKIFIWKGGDKSEKIYEGDDMNHCVAVTNSNEIVAGCGKNIIIFGRKQRVLEGHSRLVTALTLWENKIVSGDIDGKMFLSDLDKSSKYLGTLCGGVGRIDVTKNKIIGYPAFSSSCRIWNLEGKYPYESEGESEFKERILGDGRRIIHNGQSVLIYDPNQDDIVEELSHPGKGEINVILANNIKKQIVAGCDNGEVVIWKETA